MKTIFLSILLTALLIVSCQDKPGATSMEQWKNEILETERNFAAMAKEEGIPVAFLEYASEDAVMMRNNGLIKGKSAMNEYFQNQKSQPADLVLEWEPDFIDVATSGDLGYTYGKYEVTYTDSTGTKQENTGIFHTVWKRQESGKWRYVWD